MSKIHLYLAPGAWSLSAHILLHETGVPFTITKLSVANGLPETFANINPKLRIPVLRIDDQIITETPAILLAISQLQPEKNLMGSTDLDRVRVLEWLSWLSGTAHGEAYGALVRPHRFTDDPSVYGSITTKGANIVRACYEMIESRLEDAHAVGGAFTAVDLCLYVLYRWGKLGDKYPTYKALVDGVVERESTQKALRDEGIADREMHVVS